MENHWTEKQDIAFKVLKEILRQIETMGYYDIKDKTQVITDTSLVDLSDVLVQTDKKDPRIIAYRNRTLTN